MSSTNVHSEQNDNIYCAAAQIIPTGKEVEIPPKSAKKGPASLDVMIGEGMEILAGVSELHKNGQLVAKDGTPVAEFDKNAFDRISAKYNRRKERNNTAKNKYVGLTNKGEGR